MDLDYGTWWLVREIEPRPQKIALLPTKPQAEYFIEELCGGLKVDCIPVDIRLHPQIAVKL